MAAPGTRGTTNRNARGGSAARRARKQWLLEQFGNGHSAPCAIRRGAACEGRVTFETLWVDRWPVAGHEGGTYRRDNIRPSCAPCNMADGGAVGRAKQLESR
ncbi:MAG TPA: hypothetical protein VGL46_13200 [Pseudonocardiaceae bacterium]|jgi:hypothetical protein